MALNKWFKDHEGMLSEADRLIAEDQWDAEDRATIGSFYNGRPTMSVGEAADRGVSELTNHLFGYDSINTARDQIASIYSKSPTFIKIEVIGGEPNQRMFWEQVTQKWINRAIKRSGRMKPHFKGLGGELTLFGRSCLTFKDPYDWCPVMSAPFTPRGTGTTPEEVPYAIIPDYLTVKQMEDYLRMAETNAHTGRWNVAALRKAIRYLSGSTGLEGIAENGGRAQTPADELEYMAQEGMTPAESERLRLPVYFVYTSNPDKKGCPFDMSVIARYSAPQRAMAAKNKETLPINLFHHPEYYETAKDFLHTFFLDCNIGGSTTWHRTMGLGRLNYDSDVDVEEFFNAAMQGSKENLRRMWTVANSADTETIDRWLAGEMWSNVVPEGVRAAEVPKNSNFEGAMTVMGMLQDLSKRNASGAISNRTDHRQTNELEVQALERQGRNANALAHRMNDIYENLDNLAQVMFRRFTEPAILPVDSGYDDIKFFQNKMREAGIPLSFLRAMKDGEFVNVKVSINRVGGDGDRVRELMVNQMLLQRMHLFPPESQKIILRRVTALETQDFELAEELVPSMETPDSGQVGRANQENNTAILQGKTPNINPDDLHLIHIPEHLTGLEGLLRKGETQGWQPMDLIGFRALGGHAMQHIQQVAAIPEQKDIATRFTQKLQEIARVGQGFATNLQRQMEAEENEGKMSQKEQADTMLKAEKLQLEKQQHADLVSHREETQDFRERQQAHREGLTNEQLFVQQRQQEASERAQDRAAALAAAEQRSDQPREENRAPGE